MRSLFYYTLVYGRIACSYYLNANSRKNALLRLREELFSSPERFSVRDPNRERRNNNNNKKKRNNFAFVQTDKAKRDKSERSASRSSLGTRPLFLYLYVEYQNKKKKKMMMMMIKKKTKKRAGEFVLSSSRTFNK